MRRRYLPVLVGVLLLAGCGKPAGADGDLVNGWPTMAAAALTAPAAGACYASSDGDEESGTWDPDDKPDDCAQPHVSETVYVGSMAGFSSPPTGGDATPLFTTCSDRAATYVGGDWHLEQAALRVLMPDATGWAAGARWYRCDLSGISEEAAYVPITGTFKGDLTQARAHVRGCYAVTLDSGGSVLTDEVVPCGQGHNAEFAGFYHAPAQDGSAAEQDKSANLGCEPVVAKYLGLPGATDTNPAVSWWWDRPDQADWVLGDHTVWCLATIWNGKSMNGSHHAGTVKGIGNGTPKN